MHFIVLVLLLSCIKIQNFIFPKSRSLPLCQISPYPLFLYLPSLFLSSNFFKRIKTRFLCALSFKSNILSLVNYIFYIILSFAYYNLYPCFSLLSNVKKCILFILMSCHFLIYNFDMKIVINSFSIFDNAIYSRKLWIEGIFRFEFRSYNFFLVSCKMTL